MKGLGDFFCKRKDMRKRMNECDCEQHTSLPNVLQWQNLLSGRFEDLIES